ncbi:TonB-dependent receptor [Niastella caeni]|uniref:TonB-dependent receptor n=1 Tax=Niastella caeni TaxID=2569763 RepID=A0A4S8HA55_9BACT|nr:TonB-dependent receptor [Niastella caeni]THU30214.1 TonB-dependent receptor [Niastella caeni]
MRNPFLYFLLLIPGHFCHGQTDTTALEEVVVSATKFYTPAKHVAQKVVVLNKNYISKVNAQNTGDLLISTGNVFVQKSQQGGSSPVIRGFEASRVLLVVDGIRMNNAIYRAGHLQNIITVDQNMLERMEVMYGPSSTQYGSDALGGTIHMISKPARLANNGERFTPSGNSFFRYSSANAEKSAHADINLGYEKFGFLSAVTYSDFGDMKMGNAYRDKYAGFGSTPAYVTQLNNSFVDSVVPNSDSRIQKFSGYRQWDIMNKLLFRQNDKLSHVFTAQFSNSSNIPRYDRLQDLRNGTLRYAAWYYGPQEREQYSYTFQAQQLSGLFNEIRSVLSFQNIQESRQTRDFRRYDRFDSRREHIKVWGFVADAKKIFGNHTFTIGGDAQWNDLESVADRTNLQTGAVTKLDSRYPNGSNNMNYFGLYAQHSFQVKGGKWILNDGLRLQTVKLHSTIADNSFFNLPVTDMKQDPFAVTGNLGVVYLPSKATRMHVNVSSGFRAPNIDDLARVFESASALQRVVVPNAAIKPEYTYSGEAGVNHTIAGKITLEASAWYTLFRNAITLAPYQLNGQDSILYNGALCQVIANQNSNKAWVYGGSVAVTANITAQLSLYSTINYTKGRFRISDTKRSSAVYQRQPNGTYAMVQAYVKEKPLDHIPPLFGKTSLQYKSRLVDAEFFVHYNGWKKLDEYNADGEDNAQYATVEGTPSWFTLNCRTAVRINDQVILQGAVENILDRNYRYFASGFSAPGRNFVITVRTSFK